MTQREQDTSQALVPWEITVRSALAKRRVKDLLDRPDADQAIASLSEVESYYLVKELGIDDALPLLAVMGREQLRAIVDLDVWRKDRVELADLLTWLSAFADISSEKLYEAATAVDFELMGLLVRRRLLVCSAKLPEEEIPRWVHDSDDVSQTPDGRFFVGSRAIDEDDDADPDEDFDGPSLDEEERKSVVYIIDKLYKAEDWELAARILRLAETDLSSSLEEHALRFRNARLEDLGFPSRERAIEVYGPLDPEHLAVEEATSIDCGLRLPAIHAEELSRNSLLDAALRAIEDPSIVARIEGELVPLANAVLVSDRAVPGDLDGLSRSLARISGNLSLALAHGTSPSERLRVARERLERFPLRSLFRVGHTLTIRLADRARMLVDGGRLRHGRDRLGLAADRDRAILESLLLTRPLAAPDLAGGAGLSRPFASLEELTLAHAAIDDLEARLAMIAGLALPPATSEVTPPAPEWTVDSLLATVAANVSLGLAPSLEPILLQRLGEVTDALGTLERFEALLARARDPVTARAVLRRVVEQALDELRVRPFDARMIHSILVAT
ncbi:MAG: hypothetical protein HYV07_23055 [Deltaproteobacteria bacterium]|nr:hypothetical protein [Deltaproteobacteria bacterium]